MRFPNAKQDVLLILSWFREAFSSPSFKLFSSFIVGFIQLGKEGHTSSMVQSLARSFLSRSLSSFTRFLGKNSWTMDEVLATALHKFFHTLKIQARAVVFLLLDDTIIKKTGKKIPGCGWYKDHAQNLANVFGGADPRLRQMIFDPEMPDPYKQRAGTRAGAMSILTGIAAVKSIESGKPVKIADLIKL